MIAQTERAGQISRFEFDAVWVTTPGQVLPCCKESMEQGIMMIGLVKCQ